MYRSLFYRNFLSEKDNAIALMRPAWQVQTVDGEGEKKNPPPFPPHIPPLPPEPLPLSKPATQASTVVQGTTL